MGQNLHLTRFFKDIGVSLARQIASIIFGLITSIILARKLGAEGVGSYAVMVTLPTIMISLFSGGVGNSITYHIAKDRNTIQDASSEIVRFTLAFCGVAYLLSLLVVWIAGGIVGEGIDQNLLMVAITLVPLSIALTFLMAVFRGVEDYQTASLIEIIPQSAILLLSFVLVWVLNLTVLGAIIAIVIGRLLAVLVALFTLLKRYCVAQRLIALPNFDYTVKIVKYGFKAQIGYIATILNYRADVFLLNYFQGIGSVGLYDQAVALAERVWLVSQVTSMVIFSRSANDEEAGLQHTRLVTLVIRHVLWLSIVAAIIMGILAKWVVILLYGEAFQYSAIALVYLLPGIVALSVSRIMSGDLSGRGKPGINSAHSTVAAILNIVINLIMIPRFGFLGAAITTSISYSYILLIKTIAYVQITNIQWSELFIPNRDDFELWRKIFERLRSY